MRRGPLAQSPCPRDAERSLVLSSRPLACFPGLWPGGRPLLISHLDSLCLPPASGPPHPLHHAPLSQVLPPHHPVKGSGLGKFLAVQ